MLPDVTAGEAAPGAGTSAEPGGLAADGVAADGVAGDGVAGDGFGGSFLPVVAFDGSAVDGSTVCSLYGFAVGAERLAAAAASFVSPAAASPDVRAAARSLTA